MRARAPWDRDQIFAEAVRLYRDGATLAGLIAIWSASTPCRSWRTATNDAWEESVSAFVRVRSASPAGAAKLALDTGTPRIGTPPINGALLRSLKRWAGTACRSTGRESAAGDHGRLEPRSFNVSIAIIRIKLEIKSSNNSPFQKAVPR